jgi:hypothetical protein
MALRVSLRLAPWALASEQLLPAAQRKQAVSLRVLGPGQMVLMLPARTQREKAWCVLLWPPLLSLAILLSPRTVRWIPLRRRL